MPVEWLSFKRDLVTALKGKSSATVVEVWLEKQGMLIAGNRYIDFAVIAPAMSRLKETRRLLMISEIRKCRQLIPILMVVY